MQCYLDNLTQKIQEIIADCLQRMGDFARVRVAFVGYRDYDDDTPQVVHPFTTDVKQIKAFLENLEAEGGGDQCEDVLTGGCGTLMVEQIWVALGGFRFKMECLNHQ
jgi:hypothetical protein